MFLSHSSRSEHLTIHMVWCVTDLVKDCVSCSVESSLFVSLADSTKSSLTDAPQWTILLTKKLKGLETIEKP